MKRSVIKTNHPSGQTKKERLKFKYAPKNDFGALSKAISGAGGGEGGGEA